MAKDLIVVKSITYAMRGQQVLNNYGLSAYIERTTGERYGCGYSIRVKPDQVNQAVHILSDHGIRVTDVIEGRGIG